MKGWDSVRSGWGQLSPTASCINFPPFCRTPLWWADRYPNQNRLYWGGLLVLEWRRNVLVANAVRFPSPWDLRSTPSWSWALRCTFAWWYFWHRWAKIPPAVPSCRGFICWRSAFLTRSVNYNYKHWIGDEKYYDSTIEFGEQQLWKTLLMVLWSFGFIGWLERYAWLGRDRVVGLAHQHALTLARCLILAVIFLLTLIEQNCLLDWLPAQFVPNCLALLSRT